MYDAETIAALESGQLVLRDFLYIRGKDSGGSAANFGFWTGVDDIILNVVSAIDGSTESRSYVGGGTLLDVPQIVDTIGLEARSIDFGLSQLHPTVQDMLRANNIRVAVVEMHRGVYDPATWQLVSTPFPRFLGRVDGARLETAAIGGQGGITLTAISNAIDLTRSNPALKSDETQRLRSDDRFRRYADSAGDIAVFWGLTRGAA